VIGHEAIGVHLPIGFLGRSGQGFDEVLPVNVIQEDLLAPVPRLMMWYMAPGYSIRSLRGMSA
jgi:hypothetical protein